MPDACRTISPARDPAPSVHLRLLAPQPTMIAGRLLPGRTAAPMSKSHATPDRHAHRHRTDVHATRRVLWIALALTLAFALVEVVGGWLAGSLALISDAGHMVTDAASFVVALIAATVTARPPSERASYGYARAEVIAAFVNALAMLALIV